MERVSGFQAHMKQECPHFSVSGCYSLVSCVSNAVKTLPLWMEQFVGDIGNYFSYSSKIKKEFEAIPEKFFAPCHAILKIAQTRWLSRQHVIYRILEQWDAFKAF